MKPAILFFVMPVVAILAVAADAPAIQRSVLPTFTKEGYRSLLLVAAGMDFPEREDRVDMKDMQLTVFTGDATEKIEMTLVSPEATFRRSTETASGRSTVRMIGRDFDASADVWTYNHRELSISLDGNVRIVFEAELKEILK